MRKWPRGESADRLRPTTTTRPHPLPRRAMVVLDYNTYSDSPFFFGGNLASGSGQAVVEDAQHVQAHSNPRVSYYFPKGVGE